ncbi:MAG: hypothetical protein OHK0029_02080 [Armatimonadaceae bacterium]
MMDQQGKTPPKDNLQTSVLRGGLRAIDITLGVATLAIEAAEKTATYLAAHGPEWLDDMEQRGRPIRQEIFGKRTEEPAPSFLEETDAEISALERRIRELEREVSVPPVQSVSPPPAEPRLETPPATPPSSTPPRSQFVAPDIDEDETPDSDHGPDNTQEANRPE